MSYRLVSPFLKQPCKPKPWHYLHHAWTMSSYVLNHKQILFSPHFCGSRLHLFGKIQSGLLILRADEWFAACIMTSIFKLWFYFTQFASFCHQVLLFFMAVLSDVLFFFLVNHDLPIYCISLVLCFCNGSHFPSFLRFKLACFSPTDISLFFIVVYPF